MGIGARDLFAVVLFGCKIVPLSRVRIKHPKVLLVVEAPTGFFFPILPSSAGFGLLLFPGIGCHFLIYPKKKGYSQIINFPKRLFSNVLRKKKPLWVWTPYPWKSPSSGWTSLEHPGMVEQVLGGIRWRLGPFFPKSFHDSLIFDC